MFQVVCVRFQLSGFRFIYYFIGQSGGSMGPTLYSFYCIHIDTHACKAIRMNSLRGTFNMEEENNYNVFINNYL